jgi:16S rRNA A1518/A1519 N6-dimethyltransferase RsmA/KsgA/DIM1 with predicted DNA glycosylase/AP lyase activity
MAGLGAAVLLYFLYRLARNEAIFIPLPQKTIDEMLRMAEISKDDVLYDLGSGDGRVLVSAAKQYAVTAVGIEKSKVLAWLSKRKIARNCLEDKVQVVNADFFGQDLSEATIVIAYLSQKINNKLEAKLRKELKEGTRILSADHTFNFREKAKTKTGHFWTHLYII